ncbi:MAG: XRE family transcriptional regulator [Bacteroidetes bacterium]|nr:MAG: XRE family transcriptional regulator [Bacteroidota bacterium]TAG86376.1 MAG: XRE family transcriptional regulator [Bacteroidota bacterium]
MYEILFLIYVANMKLYFYICKYFHINFKKNMKNNFIMQKNSNFANIYSILFIKMNPDEIIKKLKKIREEKKISQREMSEALNITQRQYANYENLTSQITLKTFLDILKILDVKTKDIFDDEIINQVSKEEIILAINMLDDIKNRLT